MGVKWLTSLTLSFPDYLEWTGRQTLGTILDPEKKGLGDKEGYVSRRRRE